MKHLEQIDKAITYIEDNLLSPSLVVDEISKQSGMSKWHFQKVFKALTGETVKSYTLGRKIALAAKLLIESRKNILEMALYLNFNTHEGFSRAFTKITGKTPSQFRKDPSLKYFSKPKLSKDYIKHLSDSVTTSPKIIYLDSFDIRGISLKIAEINNEDFRENFKKITKVWQKLEDILSKNEIYELEVLSASGPINENEPELGLEYFAAVIDSQKSNPIPLLENRETRAGYYAEFYHYGKIENIEHTINYIYGLAIHKLDRERAIGPDLFFYPQTFSNSNDKEVTKICIPLS